MDVRYIVLAIPVFFLLIGIELVAIRIQDKDYYRLSDSISDLSCGILDQVVEVFLKTALFAGYLFLYQNHRFASLPGDSVPAWISCFLLQDMLYYWFHRWSHEVNAGWAAHIVHHQSEEYNLTVALRQGAFQAAFSWVFYLPLALAGFPPLMFLTVSSFNTLYQFWIHTRTIGRLGPLEWVLNTPSHHRVHHARNPKYIDRNHAGTLIVWDRLFGTFKAEEEEPVYGITKPLASWNPIWAQIHYWVELIGMARRARRLRDRVRVFFEAPGWRPQELGGFQAAPEVDRDTLRKYDPPLPRALKIYVLAQFVLLNVFTSFFLFNQSAWTSFARVAAASTIVVGALSLGGLLERKGWAHGLETARLAGAAAVLPWVATKPALAAIGLCLVLVSAGWLWRLRGVSVSPALASDSA
jgi:sterol desaturase/sphingolipid hydroxylase (fatty acid hydroxylase superfamily)